jgi:uncharacterized protein (TIGR03067 family)
MRFLALMAAAVVLISWTEDPQNPENRDVAERIELEKVSVADGERAKGEILKASRLVLAGDQFTLIVRETTQKGTFSVDPAALPKTIDVTFSEGPRAGKPLKGIYELNEDSCRVCIALADQPRPTEFASPAGRRHVLQVLKRVKP